MTKTVCENCSQMYPQMNPTTQNEKMMYWNSFSAISCPLKS